MYNDQQLKEIFFGTLVENSVLRNQHSKNGQLVEVKMVVRNHAMIGHINKLYKKHGGGKSFEEFTNEYLFHAWEAIKAFEIRDGSTWQDIIKGVDNANTGRLIKSIKMRCEQQIYIWVNEVKMTTIKGKHTAIKLHDTTSLDVLISDTDGETTLGELVENSFWNLSQERKGRLTEFGEWFAANKDKVLIESQLQFLENLAKASHEGDGYTANDVSKVTGVSDTNRSTYLNRIYKRTMKAYEKAAVPVRNTVKEQEIEFLSQALKFNENNEALALWVKLNIDNNFLTNLLYDNVDNRKLVQVIKGIPYDSNILYSIYNAIENRVNFLNKPQEITPTKYTPKRKKPSKTPLNSDIKVYSASTGQFLHIEKAVSSSKKTGSKMSVAKLNANGILDELNNQ